MIPTYAVFVRDADRLLQAHLDDFEQLEIILRFNQPGTWALTGINRDIEAASYFAAGAGVVIDRDGSPFLSGPMLRYRRARTTANEIVQDLLDVSGADDVAHLWRRVAHPSPADANFATQAEDIRTGTAEAVMRGYVNANAGPGAISTRRVPGLTVAADLGRGDTLTERARLDVLGEIVAAVAVKGGGLGFQVLQAGTDLEFSIYEPANLTAAVEVSDDVGNLADFSYEVAAPDRDQVYVGGEGEGTARVFVERIDSDQVTRWGRIESFRDRRDTSDVDELALTGDEELATNGELIQFEVGAVDLPNLTFGSDYNLGDQITAVIDGVAVEQVIREVRITVTAEGEEVVPILGTAGVTGSTDAVLDLFDRLRQLSNRITNMERR